MPRFEVRVRGPDGRWHRSERVAHDDAAAAWFSADETDPGFESSLVEAEVGAWSERDERFLPPRRLLVLPDGRALSLSMDE